MSPVLQTHEESGRFSQLTKIHETKRSTVIERKLNTRSYWD